MSKSYTYFSIPFESVPDDPKYTVWFACWSQKRPVLEPGMNAPFVIGATTGPVPMGGIEIGTSIKDPIPPPSPPPAPTDANRGEYQKSVREWIKLGRDA